MNPISAMILNSDQLVGRTIPLTVLRHSLEQARNGTGSTILLNGEAGVGKSRLVAELIAAAPPRTVLRGSCFESDRALPYAPILDLLQLFIAQESPALLAQHLGNHAGDLGRFIPQLQSLTTIPTPLLEPELEKRRIFESLIAFITTWTESHGETHPLIVIIEDIHWSDDTSLEFLSFLARRIPAHPVLLLLTYRPDELSPRLSHLISTLARGRLATDLPLHRLSEADVTQMVQRIFNLPQAPRADFLHSIYGLTDGNPFFVEEILRALVSGGEIVSMNGVWQRRAVDQLQIPLTVQDAVLRRMEMLSSDAKRAIALAAVVGRRFDFELLQLLTGHDEATLLQLLKEMIAAQLVREENADFLMFRHALTQQSIYRQLLARERRRLHRIVAEAVERTRPQAVGELAHHFSEAQLWDKSLHYATAAGTGARHLDAVHEAIEQWTRALTAAEHLADTTAQTTLALARGSAYNHVGDWENARQDYERALTLARQLRAPDLEGQTLLELGLLWSARDYGEARAYLEAALALARRAPDSDFMARTLNRYGNWLMNTGEPLKAQAVHREALSLFQSLGDLSGMAHTYSLLAVAVYHAGDIIGGIGYHEEGIHLWRQVGNRQALAESLMQFSVRVQFDTETHPLTSITACYADVDEAIQMARDIGWRSGETQGYLIRGVVDAFTADYGALFSDYPTSIAIAREIEHHQWLAAATSGLGRVLLDLLVPEEAAPYLEPSFAGVQRMRASLWLYHVAGFMVTLYAMRGEWAEVDALCDEIIPDAHFQGLPHGLRHLWCSKGEAALLRGDAETALQISTALIQNAFPHSQTQVIPRLWLLHGAALTALNRAAGAEPMLQAAHDTASLQRLGRYIWRIELALGHCYAAQGKAVVAARTFESVLSEINRLAESIPDSAIQTRFRERALAMLPSTRTLTPRQAAKQEAGGLTQRELEVVRLIAEGKSNRDIADALVVAERTIASHVGNILNKLGFDSRIQIALWAKESGRD